MNLTEDPECADIDDSDGKGEDDIAKNSGRRESLNVGFTMRRKEQSLYNEMDD